MKLILIRHYQTPGNLRGNYIGSTDEEILMDERKPVCQYEAVERLYVSPLKRCIQTAQIIYPEHEMRKVWNLRECDFGLFENKNYKDLSGDAYYQAWIDSNGTLPFPKGEDPSEFKRRCQEAFEAEIIECIKQKIASVAFVVHGGTIMSIMEKYDRDQKGYYDYQVRNGEGYLLNLEEYEWESNTKKIDLLKKIVKEATE